MPRIRHAATVTDTVSGVNSSVHIELPAEAIWAAISDVHCMGEWSPETTSCAWRGAARGPAVGARFRGHNRLRWVRWFTDCAVVACEPGREFAFDVHFGPVPDARWRYRLEPDDDGTGCTVTEDCQDRRPAVLAKLSNVVMGIPDRAEHNRAGIQMTLAQLKDRLEARHGRRASGGLG